MAQFRHNRRSTLGLLGATAALALAGCRTDGADTGPGDDRADSHRPFPGRGGRPDTSSEPGPGTVPTDGFGVHGVVRDRQNRPVPAAFIQALPVGADTPAVPELAVFTDADGAYHWPLPGGRYRLQVTHERGTAEAQVQVPRGGRVRLDLELR
jgi:hypothetical protein